MRGCLARWNADGPPVLTVLERDWVLLVVASIVAVLCVLRWVEASRPPPAIFGRFGRTLSVRYRMRQIATEADRVTNDWVNLDFEMLKGRLAAATERIAELEQDGPGA